MAQELLNTTKDESHDSTRKRSRNLGGKYLTFRLGNEQYGLEILKVREIMGWIQVTRVPKSPPSVQGVINLRGKIIPVIDLRRKFGMKEVPNTDRTCIIVVDVMVRGESADIGILVDNVSEVMTILQDDIGPAPSMGNAMDMSYILGIAKANGSVTILLEIENVLADSEFTRVGVEELETVGA